MSITQTEVLRTDLDRCKDAGMNGYIPKPFKAHELIVGIAEALNIKLKLNKEKKQEVHKEPTRSSLETVTDLNYLREFCEGDEVKMKKYIDVFLKSVPGILEILDQAQRDNDMTTIADQIHGYKTKLIMMGMTSTKELSVELEYLCRENGDRQKIQEILGIIKLNLESAVIELNDF